MASTSSQCCKRCESDTVPKRLVMPRDIFDAALKGDNNVLIERLGLQTKEQTKIQVTVRFELQSATHFGDTVLHLLVTKKHNELALMVFERDPSLLKTQNNKLETTLHCAAKVGNQEVILKFIDIEPAVVKDVLQETNEKGDTALHVAVRYNCADICRNLMEFDSELAYKVNKEKFSPFHIAIDEEYDSVAKQMLCVDPVLACTQLTDGMFPVHLAARKNNKSMVLYFMKNFPDYAELVDSRGRNLIHFAAEEANDDLFFLQLSRECEDMMTTMNYATDYEGNTPLHIAAMKGHRWTMLRMWMMDRVVENVRNKRGLTPYEVSKKKLKENSNENRLAWRIYSRINAYEKNHGEKFSEEWFVDVMFQLPSLENEWERTQVIGLGSVLITTVTFAAAFTIPGGYNQDHGTPVLGRRYMFRAFILANTLAFIQGFISLYALLRDALPGPKLNTLEVSSMFFLLAASSMIISFGLGLYVTLAPTCLSIAIIVLVITLLIGSLVLILDDFMIKITRIISDWSILALCTFSFLFIFCLALLSR